MRLSPTNTGDCHTSSAGDGDVSCLQGAIPSDHCYIQEKNVFNFHVQNVPSDFANSYSSLSNISFILQRQKAQESCLLPPPAQPKRRPLCFQTRLRFFLVGKTRLGWVIAKPPPAHTPPGVHWCCCLKHKRNQAANQPEISLPPRTSDPAASHPSAPALLQDLPSGEQLKLPESANVSLRVSQPGFT